MAEIHLCDPGMLYNLLNQTHGPRDYPNVSDSTYMLLLDMREEWEYNESHIVTAIHPKENQKKELILPYGMDLSTLQNIIVYDDNSSTIVEETPALLCARKLSVHRVEPVHVLKGGYERFSAVYPFLRSHKSLFNVHELEQCPMWPLEVLSEIVYLGNFHQAKNSALVKALKVRAIATVSSSDMQILPTVDHKHFVVCDAESADNLSDHFEGFCIFVDSFVSRGIRILVACKSSRNLAPAMLMAFLIKHRKMTLKEAYSHLLSCQTLTRPHRRVVQQLSQWESICFEKKQTDVSDPAF